MGCALHSSSTYRAWFWRLFWCWLVWYVAYRL